MPNFTSTEKPTLNNILAQFFKLIRVHHWVKNIAVFFPVFFAGKALDIISSGEIYDLFMLFISFCITSSIIYVINDSVDYEKDKLHPVKCKRPIASGFFSKKHASYIVSMLFIADFIILLNLGSVIWFVIAYFALNLAYTFKLKNIALVDVTCVSLGFLLRILAGGASIDVVVSHWMIIIIFLLSISIAFAKRRDDFLIIKEGETLRGSQFGYNLVFLDIAKAIGFSVTLVSYIMYSVSSEVVEKIGSNYVYTTSFFVFIGIMRYLQASIVRHNAGSPIKILMKDTFMQLIIISWFSLFSILIYVT